MSEKTQVNVTVKAIVDELKSGDSARFSKSDFLTLLYAILSDESFKAKKYLIRGNLVQVNEVSYNAGMRKFLDKLLKHAGMTDSDERSNVLDTFEYSSKDIDWIADAVDEAMYIYSDCDKNMRIFREKMLQLTVKRMVRTGKYAGKVTFKKSVIDRTANLNKKAAEAG